MNVIGRCSGRRDEKPSSGEMWRWNESLQRRISLFFLIKPAAAGRVGHLAHPAYLCSCSPFTFGGCAQLNVILTWFQCIDPIDSASTSWALVMSQEDMDVNLWLPVSSLARHGTFLKRVSATCRKPWQCMEGVVNWEMYPPEAYVPVGWMFINKEILHLSQRGENKT